MPEPNLVAHDDRVSRCEQMVSSVIASDTNPTALHGFVGPRTLNEY